MADAPPSLGEAGIVWAKIGLLSFGGPAGQIALMHRELVERRRWIAEDRFLHALNFCMLLPGPEAQQLATYIGWLLHGWRGGLIAGTLFVLPGLVTIVALSATYASFRGQPWLDGILFGLKAAVVVVVVEAVFRLGKRALRGGALKLLAGLGFVALFAFNAPFPLVILVAGLVGFAVTREPAGAAGAVEAPAAPLDPRKSLATAAIWGAAWLAPLGLALAFKADIYISLWRFFSQMAVVTFGGAYAVLAYVAQAAVAQFGWLTPHEMLDGLALAETTPGPLVLVLSYVGFIAAARAETGLPPLFSGVLGALIVAWVTFVPSFLWIFLGAPYMERLRTHAALSGALRAITAAVVGVIANLALWLALHVLFGATQRIVAGPIRLTLPVWATLDGAALALTLVAALALLRFKAGLIGTLLLSAGLGLMLAFFFP